jgi:hypothetical protein
MVVISRGSSESDFASADEPTPIVHIVFAGNLVDLNDLVVVIDRDVWIDSVIVLHSVRTRFPYNARTATSRVLEVPDSIIEARATAARFMHLHDDTIAPRKSWPGCDSRTIERLSCKHCYVFECERASLSTRPFHDDQNSSDKCSEAKMLPGDFGPALRRSIDRGGPTINSRVKCSAGHAAASFADGIGLTTRNRAGAVRPYRNREDSQE